MKFYKIGYWSHEESPSFFFTNNTDYTQKQFNQIIIDIIKNLKQLISKEKFQKLTFENILEDVVEELKAKYEFVIIKPKNSFVPFGWANIFNKEKGWESETKYDDINILINAFRNEE